MRILLRMNWLPDGLNLKNLKCNRKERRFFRKVRKAGQYKASRTLRFYKTALIKNFACLAVKKQFLLQTIFCFL